MRSARIRECQVDFDMARAVAILRAAHKSMKRPRGSEANGREHPALGDLELAGIKTGAVDVTPKRKRRRRKAA